MKITHNGKVLKQRLAKLPEPITPELLVIDSKIAVVLPTEIDPSDVYVGKQGHAYYKVLVPHHSVKIAGGNPFGYSVCRSEIVLRVLLEEEV